MQKANRLQHGGIMANYQCNAACRHCLYGCSPDWGDDYISAENAGEVCRLLVKGGCRSVHIGGGEPFLNFEGLLDLLKTARRAGIRVEYVETNGFWASDEAQARRYLDALEDAGGNALCISLDPFHAEYVPFALPLRLAEICRKTGFGHFLWQERFLQQLANVTPTKAHNRAALEEQISADYILDTARRYGIGMGGRAVNIEREYSQPKPLGSLLENSPCRDLLSTGHFHVDYLGRFIPPGCTGIAIPLAEVVEGIPEGKYPAFDALTSGGAASLLEYAKGRGFVPEAEYTSGCSLCFFTRKWLSENGSCPELEPKHYTESLNYYD